MSNGLTLPFSKSEAAPGHVLFQVINTSGAGGGLVGNAYGTGQGEDFPIGVSGDSDVGIGVLGHSKSSNGVQGGSQSGAGVYGVSNTGQGVWGDSQDNNGVYGTSRSPTGAAISAVNDSGGPGVWARGRPAGHFEGNVEVNGKISTPKTNDLDATLAQLASEIAALQNRVSNLENGMNSLGGWQDAINKLANDCLQGDQNLQGEIEALSGR